MNRSPLHKTNAELGARFISFGGWEMPGRFDSVLAEHRAVRTAAGFFDVTHLGRFELTGGGAHAAVRRLLCNDIDRVGPGRCQYTMILNDDGGIVDDMIVWWWDEESFWVFPNAVNQERVMATFGSEPGCEVGDLQMNTVLIAIQGPDAPGVIEEIFGQSPGRFRAITVEWEGRTLRMAGTGYTGEPGAEVCTDAETGRLVVEELVTRGLTPCGLGARDTLRLEAGLTLWGQDIDETTTPLEAGLDFAVSLDHDFIGQKRLEEQADGQLSRKLIGLKMETRGIPRTGYRVRSPGGGVGHVTSGNTSPILDTGIGLAYVSPPPRLGDEIEVEIRDRWLQARVVEPPFHES